MEKDKDESLSLQVSVRLSEEQHRWLEAMVHMNSTRSSRIPSLSVTRDEFWINLVSYKQKGIVGKTLPSPRQAHTFTCTFVNGREVSQTLFIARKTKERKMASLVRRDFDSVWSHCLEKRRKTCDKKLDLSSSYPQLLKRAKNSRIDNRRIYTEKEKQ